MADSDDHELAHRLATEAGAMLVDLRCQLTEEGATPAGLKAAGDRSAHLILSEEGRDNLARLDADRVWIIDPLDGTREFSEVPRIDWAVHVALVEDGQPTAGAVALPAVGVTHSTAQPPQILAEPNRPPRLAVSRSRPLLGAMAWADELVADIDLDRDAPVSAEQTLEEFRQVAP